MKRRLHHRNRPSADIYIESHHDDGDYLVEIQRAATITNSQSIKRDLERYHRAIDTGLGRTRKRTFLCVVGRDTEPATYGESRKSRSLAEYMDVPSTINELEEELEQVEVISNTYL